MNYFELKHLIPKKSEYWTVSQVIRWLQFISLPKCCPLFETLQIDGISLKKLTVSDLHHKVGIKSKVICKKLINWIIYGLQQFDMLLQQNTQSQPSPAQSLQQTQNNDYKPEMPQVCLKKSIKKKQQHSLLILKRAELKQNFYYKVKERDCRVGSDENCQIQVSGDHIQSFHAQVCFRNGFYFLRNISRNSNVFFKLNSRVPVIYGMKVQMGSNIFQFHLNEQKQMQVKIVEGKNENYQFKFTKSQQKISIGRKSTNDISFPHDITLSNLHAKLTNSDKMWYLQDLATTNGTWIELEDECKIYTGLVFKLGLTNVQLECQIRQVRDQEQQQLTIMSAASQTDTCQICHSNMKNCLFMPCNHCAVCQYCGVNIKNCTVCSQKVTNTAKIFKS